MATQVRAPSVTTVFDVYAEGCPARALLSLVTSRWAVLVIGALEDAPLRFGALRRRLEGVSQKVLAEKLRDLEGEGLLARTVVDRPLAVRYELTPLGRTLVEPLTALRVWAQRHCDEPPRPADAAVELELQERFAGSGDRAYGRVAPAQLAPKEPL